MTAPLETWDGEPLDQPPAHLQEILKMARSVRAEPNASNDGKPALLIVFDREKLPRQPQGMDASDNARITPYYSAVFSHLLMNSTAIGYWGKVEQHPDGHYTVTSKADETLTNSHFAILIDWGGGHSREEFECMTQGFQRFHEDYLSQEPARSF